jgi:hypothetical protein
MPRVAPTKLYENALLYRFSRCPGALDCIGSPVPVLLDGSEPKVALVGIAGAFIGYHLAVLLSLSRGLVT